MLRKWSQFDVHKNPEGTAYFLQLPGRDTEVSERWRNSLKAAQLTAAGAWTFPASPAPEPTPSSPSCSLEAALLVLPQSFLPGSGNSTGGLAGWGSRARPRRLSPWWVGFLDLGQLGHLGVEGYIRWPLTLFEAQKVWNDGIGTSQSHWRALTQGRRPSTARERREKNPGIFH